MFHRFQFFDKEQITESDRDAISKIAPTCATSGRGFIILGDSYGLIHMIDREYKVTTFSAFSQALSHIKLVKDKNILVAVGNEDASMSPTVKLFNMDKLDQNGIPLQIRDFKLGDSRLPINVPVTCIDATDDLSKLAIGFCNGVIMLTTAAAAREKPVSIMYRPEGKEPITSLTFAKIESRGEFRYFLYYTTSTQTFVVSFIKNNTTEKNLDSEGAELHCTTLREGSELAIGRMNGVFCYNTEERGASFGLEGSKKLLGFFRGYLIVVTEQKSYGGAITNGVIYDDLKIYDLKNQFIAYNDTKLTGIVNIISEWGAIFVICFESKGCSIFKLEEKDTQTKLETLFKKGLYSVAVDLAKTHHYDRAAVSDILTRYADHLYGKGDYNGAIEQYCKTIGNLEPSYVIRKFLDAQRIHNLTTYLQKLHECGKATADHTTLLLNCYTKLKDVVSLEKFLKSDSQEVNFDVETAIKVCRQAGYIQIALYLAKKFQQHDWYLKLLLEDTHQYEEALSYIEELDFDLAESNIKKYGKVLINEIPDKTTRFLMRLCTEEFETDETEADGTPIWKQASPEEFIHIFVSQPPWLTTFLEHCIGKTKNISSLVYDTLLECYLRDKSEYSTAKETPEEIKGRLDKAYALLTNPDLPYDPDQALVQAQAHHFDAGILYLMDRLRLHNVLLHYHMEHNNHDAIIALCKKSSSKDPSLWIQVLSYFASCETNCSDKIAEILKIIDTTNILPPLLVIQILASKPNVSLGVVKDYIVGKLEREQALIVENTKQIRTGRDETEKMKKEITDLTTGARIFQLNKCTLCHQQLDLPAVHFLCLHSFHQRCLGDIDECSECAPGMRQTLERARAQESDACKHEQFMRHLQSSSDGFGVVSEYFGRGIFNVLSRNETQEKQSQDQLKNMAGMNGVPGMNTMNGVPGMRPL